MKLSILIFALLSFEKSNAAFFDEFNKAMYSVQSNFESMVTDAVADVRVTVDCTMFAFERVLTLSGIISQGRVGCGRNVDYDEEIYEPYVEPVLPETVIQTKEFITNQMDSAINDANKTLFDIIQNREIQHQLDIMQNEVLMDADVVNEIRDLILRNQNKDSDEPKKIVQVNIEDIRIPDNTNIEEKLSVLRDLEKAERNPSNVEEIRNVFDELVGMLNNTEIKANVNVRKIDLNHNTNGTDNNDSGNFLSGWNEENVTSNQEVQDKINDDLPKSFKEVAFKIFNEKDRQRDSMNIDSNLPFYKDTGTEEFKNGQLVKSDTNLEPDKEKPPQFFSSLSDIMPKDKESEVKVIQNAQSIMEENQYAEMLMSNIFDNPEIPAQDVFSSPQLFTFG